MLEPWIIEQIRRREEEERRRNEQPVLELPVSDGSHPMRRDRDDRPEDDEDEEKEPRRGVIIIGM